MSVAEQNENLGINNPDLIQNWERLKNEIPETSSFRILDSLPGEYIYPPVNVFRARSCVTNIDKSYWNDLVDPYYVELWQKEKFVAEYFSVALYSIDTDPKAAQTIPKGIKVVTQSTVEVASTIKNIVESNFSLKTMLGLKKSGLSASIESNYSIKNVLESSCSRVQRESKTLEIEASNQNRLFVSWVFSKAVLVYRQKISGEIALIGASEWAEQVFDKVYEYNGI